MMRMPSIMDKYRQKKNQLTVKRKALKWVKTNSAFPKGSP
jgi:hypothetical protein